MEEWLDVFNAYRVSAQHTFSLVLAVAVWRWGGGPERWSMAVFLGTMVLPIYAMRWLDLGYLADDKHFALYLLTDLAAAALFVAVALNANRNYPLWVAGFQLVALGGQLARVLFANASPLAYTILIVGPAYCQLLLIAAGFVRHVLRQRRFGPYREWRQAAPFARGLQF